MAQDPPDVQRPQSLPPVEVRRGSFARLTIYEVEESELEILAQGSPDSLFLNFSIFLLSIATSFLVTLITVDVSTRVFIVFVSISAIGFFLGLFLLLLWFKNRKSVSLLLRKIRSRLTPESQQLALQFSDDKPFQLPGDVSEEEAEALLKLMDDE